MMPRPLPRPGLLGARNFFRPMRHARLFSTEKPKVTKSQLLAQATSSFSRAWVHVKWPLTRNNRPLSLEDFSAVASWLVMGNLLWVVLGTTTFGLVAMYSVDQVDKFRQSVLGENDESVKDDSFLGGLAGSILSHGLGLKFVFEKGNVMPELADGMLKFKNVKVYSTSTDDEHDRMVFSARISQLNMDLSFKKWYEGNGLVDSMEIYGIHAKVYRNYATAARDGELLTEKSSTPFNAMALSFSRDNDSNNVHSDTTNYNYEELEQAIHKNRSQLIDADYRLSLVRVHDSFFELYENNDTQPFQMSIFNCDLPQLRGDRLLIDFFNAKNVTGAVNNSMFTIHKRQTFLDSDNIVRFKLDGIDMGSLSMANPQLKFNWIVNGKAEIVADIRMPEETKAAAATGAFQSVLDEFKGLTSPKDNGHDAPSENSLLKGAINALYETFSNQRDNEEDLNDSDYVIVNVKVKFKNLKATLPLHLPMASSRAVPFVTLQNLRQLIAYINSIEDGKPLVINTTVIEKISDLYNLDNISQTRVFDAIVSDIYDDLLHLIKLDEKRIMDEKSSMWSHSVVSQLLLLGLGVLA